MKKNILTIAFLLLSVILIAGCEKEENVDISEYKELNPQELHQDYIDNEIAAKDKYTDNYYYFSGKIHDIEQFLNDNYLEIRYTYDKDKTKIIELNAYFKNADDLKELKKDEDITVYCKFYKRTLENYHNTITTYSFKNCKLK